MLKYLVPLSGKRPPDIEDNNVRCLKKAKGHNNLLFAPWWDYRKAQLSQWLPFDVHNPCKNTHLSWVSKSSSSPSSPAPVTVHPSNVAITQRKEVKHANKRSKEEVTENEIMRSIKVKISPTPAQKKIFHHIFGITRFVYNKAIDRVNDGAKASWVPIKMELLNKDKNPEAAQYPWLFDHKQCPYDAKCAAVHELCASIASTKESLKAKKKDPKKFEMKYREKKDLHQRFHIDVNGGKPSVKFEPSGFSFWPRMKIGAVKVAKKKELEKVRKLCGEEGSKNRATLKYESPGRYYLIFSYVATKKDIKERTTAIALDPGVRTFQAGYDNTGRFTDIGSKDISKVFEFGKRMDKLHSKIDCWHKDQYINKQERIRYKNDRHRFRKQFARMRQTVQNWMRDAHWKIARDLVFDYDHVLVSHFMYKLVCVHAVLVRYRDSRYRTWSNT